MTVTHAKSLFLLRDKDNSEIMTPSLLLPFNQDNPAIMVATYAQNLLLYAQIGSANITATHAQNSLLLCVQDDPANSKLHLIDNSAITIASSLQLIVESLFLLHNEDNSETMAPSLLLFCIKDAPAIMTVPLANFSLQLIVDIFCKISFHFCEDYRIFFE